MTVAAAGLRFATSAAVLRWPASFGRRFIVTVDTEEEFDWDLPLGSTPPHVSAIAGLPEMHDRLRRHGVSAIYLVDYPVAADAEAAATIRDILARDSGAAVGAQLHPWVNPPALEHGGEAATFQGNLAPEIEAAKLDRLVAALRDAFGAPPLIYRAGRYGIGAATVAALASRGFRLDASMRARFDYRDQGGPDFTHVAPGAFALAAPHREARIAELPLSTIYIGVLRRYGAWLHPVLGRVPRGRGVAARTGLLSRVPLTPEGTSAREAIRAIRTAADDGERLLQLTFHSPSLVPGHTPYVRTPADLARFHAWWEAVLPALAREGYAPATLSEVIAAADACQDGVPPAS